MNGSLGHSALAVLARLHLFKMRLKNIATQCRAVVVAELDRRPGPGGKHKQHRGALGPRNQRPVPPVRQANADITSVMPGRTDPL